MRRRLLSEMWQQILCEMQDSPSGLHDIIRSEGKANRKRAIAATSAGDATW